MPGKKKAIPDYVVWFGGTSVGCLRCGARGTLPTGCSLRLVARFMADYGREHRKCREMSPMEADE